MSKTMADWEKALQEVAPNKLIAIYDAAVTLASWDEFHRGFKSTCYHVVAGTMTAQELANRGIWKRCKRCLDVVDPRASETPDICWCCSLKEVNS